MKPPSEVVVPEAPGKENRDPSAVVNGANGPAEDLKNSSMSTTDDDDLRLHLSDDEDMLLSDPAPVVEGISKTVNDASKPVDEDVLLGELKSAVEGSKKVNEASKPMVEDIRETTPVEKSIQETEGNKLPDDGSKSAEEKSKLVVEGVKEITAAEEIKESNEGSKSVEKETKPTGEESMQVDEGSKPADEGSKKLVDERSKPDDEGSKPANDSSTPVVEISKPTHEASKSPAEDKPSDNEATTSTSATASPSKDESPSVNGLSEGLGSRVLEIVTSSKANESTDCNVEDALMQENPDLKVPETSEENIPCKDSEDVTPDSAMDVSDSVIDLPDSATAVSDSAMDVLDSATDASDSVTAITDSTSDAPDSAMEVSDSVTDLPDSATAVSDSVIDPPDSATAVSDSAMDVLHSATDTPDSVTAISDSTSDAPDSAMDVLNSATDAPDSMTATSDSTSDAPDLAMDVLESVTDKDSVRDVSGVDSATVVSHEDLAKDVHDKHSAMDLPNKDSSMDVTDESPLKDIANKNSATDVPDKGSAADVSDEIPSKDVADEHSAIDVHDEQSATDATHEIPSKDVADKQSAMDVTDKAPSKDAADQNSATDVPDKDSATDATDKVPSKDVTGKNAAIDVPDKVSETDVPHKDSGPNELLKGQDVGKPGDQRRTEEKPHNELKVSESDPCSKSDIKQTTTENGPNESTSATNNLGSVHPEDKVLSRESDTSEDTEGHFPKGKPETDTPSEKKGISGEDSFENKGKSTPSEPFKSLGKDCEVDSSTETARNSALAGGSPGQATDTKLPEGIPMEETPSEVKSEDKRLKDSVKVAQSEVKEQDGNVVEMEVDAVSNVIDVKEEEEIKSEKQSAAVPIVENETMCVDIGADVKEDMEVAKSPGEIVENEAKIGTKRPSEDPHPNEVTKKSRLSPPHSHQLKQGEDLGIVEENEKKHVKEEEKSGNTKAKSKEIKVKPGDENVESNRTQVEPDDPEVKSETKSRPIFADFESAYDFYKTNSFKNITKKGLIELIELKFCDCIANRSGLGEMRTRMAHMEEECYRMTKVSNMLKKQLTDAKEIIKKLVQDREIQKKTGKIATPLRVTRCVGLQVCTSGTFYMRPKNTFKPPGASEGGDQPGSGSDKVIDLETGNGGTPLGKPQGAQVQQAGGVKRGIASSPSGLVMERAPSTRGPSIAKKSTASASAHHNGFISSPPPLAPRPHSSLVAPLTVSQAPPPQQVVTLQALRPRPSTQLTTPTQKKDEVSSSKALTPSPRQPGSNNNNNNASRSVRHYIIASPVKTPVTPTTPIVNSMKVASPAKSSDKPEKTKTAPDSSSNSMEIIDLTDKDDKVVQPTKPQTPAKQMTASPQTQSSNKVQKKPDVTTGKVICSVNNENRILPKEDKPEAAALIDAISKLPPLPSAPKHSLAMAPPRPFLRICKSPAGIMLSWNFGHNKIHTEIATFELYAYQERTDNSPKIWNKVGDVKALPLPMACTLTQFVDGQKYHFAVRAIDIHDRVGEFSSPGSIMLTLKGQQ